MRLPKVSIDHWFFPESHLPGGVEGLVGKSFLRARLEGPLLPFADDVGAHPELGVLVGDDLSTGFAEGVVRSRALKMPVRVEKRLYLATAGLFGDYFQQFDRVFRRAAVN